MAMNGGYLVGNSHANGGIKIITPEGQIEAEGNEVIINKRVLAKDDKFVCEGTPKEITSKINEMEGGVSWSETGSCKLVRKAEDGTEIEEEGNISDDGFGLLYTKNNKKFIITADTKDQIELIDMAIKDYKDGLIDKENLENTLQSYINDEEEFSGDIVYNNGKPFVYNDFYRGYIELYDEMPIDATSSEIEFALGGSVKTKDWDYSTKDESKNLPKELVKQKINELENQFQALRLEFRNNLLSQEEYFNEKQDLINKYNDYIDAAKRQDIAINQSLFLGIIKKKEKEEAARGTILRSSNPEKRPSPSVSATIYPEGYEMEGNDGNTWVISIDSRGVHRWKRLKAEDGAELESNEQYSIQQPKEKIATKSTDLFVFNDKDMAGLENFYRYKEDMEGSTIENIYFDFTYDFYKGGKYLCSAQIILNDFSNDVEDAPVDKWDYATESHYTETEGYYVTYTPGGFYIEETVDADGKYLELSGEDMDLLKAEIGAIFKEKIMHCESEYLPKFQLTYGELLDILKKHNIEKAADGMKNCGCGCGVAEDGKEISSCGCSHSNYADGGGIAANGIDLAKDRVKDIQKKHNYSIFDLRRQDRWSDKRYNSQGLQKPIAETDIMVDTIKNFYSIIDNPPSSSTKESVEDLRKLIGTQVNNGTLVDVIATIRGYYDTPTYSSGPYVEYFYVLNSPYSNDNSGYAFKDDTRTDMISAKDYFKGKNVVFSVKQDSILGYLIKKVIGESAFMKDGGGIEQAARGKVIVTKIEDIPNLQQELKAGRITYRGLGLGKLYDDFYKIANESGTRIKVEGKEYYITDTDFRKLNWDEKNKKWKNLIRFSAPHRKGYANGGGIDSSELKSKYNELASLLEKNKIPCRIKLTDKDIIVELGFNYPDKLAYKVFDAYESIGLESNLVNICAESSGDMVLESRRIMGGSKRYFSNGGGVEKAEKGKELWFTPSGKLSAEKEGSARKMIEMRLAQMFGATSMSLVGEDEKHFIYELEGNPQKIEMVTAKLQEDKGLDVETYGRKKRVHIPKTAILQSSVYVRFPLLTPFKDGGKLEMLNDVPKGYLYLSNITNTSRKPNGALTSVYKTNLSHLPSNQVEQVNLYLESLNMDYTTEDVVPNYNPEFNDENYSTENYVIGLQVSPEKIRYFFVDTQGYDYPRYVTELINYNPEYYDNGGKITESELETIKGYERKSKEDYDNNLKIAKGDDEMTSMYRKDFSDHVWVATLMRDGKWEMALKVWQDMDTASRENISNEAYELLMGKNNLSTYRDGGGVEEGATIRIEETPYMASFSNLYGKDLVIKYIKNVNFASGPQKYFIVEVDGEEYEVPERFVKKYEDGGGVGSEKWQIRNSAGRYYSVSMQSGNPVWNESPDLGYSYKKEEAEIIKNKLIELGNKDLEVVEYNPNWWKMANGGGVNDIKYAKLKSFIENKKYKEAIDYYLYHANITSDFVGSDVWAKLKKENNFKEFEKSYNNDDRVGMHHDSYANGGGVGSSELDEWYGRQPFDNVYKITGIDLWDYPEADDIDENDLDTMSRDKAIDEARDIWNNMSIEEKREWYDEIGDEYSNGGGVGEILSDIDDRKYSTITKEWGDIHIIPTSDSFWDEIKILLDKSNIKYTTERYDVGTEYFKIKDKSKYDNGGGVGENSHLKGESAYIIDKQIEDEGTKYIINITSGKSKGERVEREVTKYYVPNHPIKEWTTYFNSRKEAESYAEKIGLLIEYSNGGGVSQAKSKRILHEGMAKGHTLTEKQKKFFGARASGYPVMAKKGASLKNNYEIYHETLARVIDEIENYAKNNGYEVGEYFPKIQHVAYGTSFRTMLELLKDNKISNSLAIQIYRLDSGRYELTMYATRKMASDGKPIGDADYLTNAMLSILDLHAYVSANDNKIKIFGSEYTYMAHSKYNLRVTGGKGAVYNIIPYFPTSTVEKLQQAHFYTLVRQGRSYNFAITKQNEIVDLAEDGIQILTIS